MEVRVLVGGENFEELRRRGCYYVDKTELLYELAHDAANKVTLFTRPRRFGKTLTMRMMESFFDISRDSREVFQGLAVMEHQAFCREWMNQYPVLFVTLKDAEGLNFQGAYGKLRSIIADVCKDHAYLENSQKVDKDDLRVFARLKAKESSEEEIKGSLLLLRLLLGAGRKVQRVFRFYTDGSGCAAQGR